MTATAQFYYRPTTVGCGLCSAPVAHAIPFAEVAVLNSSGAIIQCGTTDVNGGISVTVPNTAGNYSVLVYSRSANSKLYASVLEDIYSNQPYSISANFSLAGNGTGANAGTLTAYARASETSKIEGGAFNILYDLYKANEYIRTQISDSSFVAPKVIAYWKAGFNPYAYFGDATNLLSFYATGTRKLYILGGYNGSLQTDTDHFDDSVIIHEYGHFLEDIYSKPESPGGSHDGNHLVDPRLAWSEGWANFLQAAVQGNQYYIDTIGFHDAGDTSVASGGTAMLGNQIDLSQAASSASRDRIVSGCTNCNGEGTFREISISRTLYKTIDPTNVNVPFSAIWTAFSSSTAGLAVSSLLYRNAATFLGYLDANINSNYASKVASWNTMLSSERQSTNQTYYGDLLSVSATACSSSKTMDPVIDFTYGTGYRSDPLRSNRFYKFVQDGSISSITVEYTAATSTSGDHINLDLILYNSSYAYIDDQYLSGGNSSIIASSRKPASVDYDSSSGTYKETISVGSLAAGTYMLNVKALTLNKLSADLDKTVTFNLKTVQNGNSRYLCPAH